MKELRKLIAWTEHYTKHLDNVSNWASCASGVLLLNAWPVPTGKTRKFSNLTVRDHLTLMNPALVSFISRCIVKNNKNGIKGGKYSKRAIHRTTLSLCAIEHCDTVRRWFIYAWKGEISIDTIIYAKIQSVIHRQYAPVIHRQYAPCLKPWV